MSEHLVFGRREDGSWEAQWSMSPNAPTTCCSDCGRPLVEGINAWVGELHEERPLCRRCRADREED